MERAKPGRSPVEPKTKKRGPPESSASTKKSTAGEDAATHDRLADGDLAPHETASGEQRLSTDEPVTPGKGSSTIRESERSPTVSSAGSRKGGQRKLSKSRCALVTQGGP